MTQASLRAAIIIVPQDGHGALFNDTVEYNIAYGLPGRPAPRSGGGARGATSTTSSPTPKGYETTPASAGSNSPAARSSASRSRTLLKNPPILIFDEATSALTLANERAIQAELKSARAGQDGAGRAHRLSTVVDAQRILVLHQGASSRRGTHDELLAAAGATPRCGGCRTRDRRLRPWRPVAGTS